MQVKLGQPINCKLPSDWVIPTDPNGGIARWYYGTDREGVLHVYRFATGSETACGHKPTGAVPFEEAHYCESCFLVPKGDA